MTTYNGCSCGVPAVKVPCVSDYCEPKQHPHEAPHIVRVPWLKPGGFAPVCCDALQAMRADPAVLALWQHYAITD